MVSHLFFTFLMTINVASLFFYGSDKWKAIHKRWRIPESVLLGLAFAGGAAGALAGMLLFRHKIRKAKFRFLVPTALILWIIAVVVLYIVN